METVVYDDEPPPEPRDGWLLVRIHVPELNVYKCLQFPSDKIVWDVKQQCLASLPKELKESFNYGLFCPPSNGKAGKFLDEERRLGDYPFNGPVGYLELKYKRRVYKMLNLDERQLKALHTRANLRRFLECINGGHVEKVSKMCAKGLDPNFHCSESGETPLTIATATKKPNKLLIALVNGGALLDYRTKDGVTALHRAVERDSLEAVSTLLELGASPNYRDTKNLTPVYLSVTKKTDPKICELLLHDHATLGVQDTQGWQEVHQVAVIAGNLELAEMIQNYKSEDIVPFRGPPRYNPRRRSGLGWGATLSRIGGPPSPCPSEHPFSSASSSLSEGSSSQRSHEDDISIVTDKSLGDTSDIISDSSGVGTNSDSAACSIGHPSTTVVCMELYTSNVAGHLNIQPGDVIEVVGSTDCGLLEGYVRGTNRTGFFPIECVQEVHFRQKNITNVSTVNSAGQYRESMQAQTVQQDQQMVQQEVQLPQQKLQQHYQSQQQQPHGQYSSSTAPRMKKISYSEPRNVVLHRAKRGFGFILRGAKASSPLMQLKPSNRCPALQYLDDVDPGGVADMAGLKPGDFLITINGVDVTCASHENVVDLIRSSGSLVSMTVLTLPNLDHMETNGGPPQMHGGMSSIRQCATLPRRIHGPGKPAPAPPRRDPKTTLSVGRARAKSMVAGLEGGTGLDHDEDDAHSNPTKSNSTESLHQQTQSAISTPTQGGPGTPVQPRTASIKARPTSSRITAAELEELFQRQQGADASRCSTMMTTSRFQSGLDSGAATPPTSPQKGPLVYASVADMKRKKTRNGTLKGRAIPIPTVSSDLRRTFHSTPDLATNLAGSTNSATWSSAIFKNHRSQDDVNYVYNSMQRLNLPPPTHPPPPPPVGQVVKVEVSRGSEYESTVALQNKILQKKAAAGQASKGQIVESEVMSSFRPAANAKLYASPQDIRNVGYRAPAAQQESPQMGKNQVRKSSSVRSNNSSSTLTNTPPMSHHNLNPYAQPGRPGLTMSHQQRYGNKADLTLHGPPPAIPDPDYSLSESDGEGDNSVRLKGSNISVIEVNGGSGTNTNNNNHAVVNNGAVPNPGMAIETSGNSNASGSSSGSSSIPHSFSVDEIQKIRTKLKSSKSYPNDFLRQQQQQQKQQQRHAGDINEEGDNSSSGVSSDQEIPPAMSLNTSTNNGNGKAQPIKAVTQTHTNNGDIKKPTTLEVAPKTQTLTKKVTLVTAKSESLEQRSDIDDDSPSPPAKGFQRHNSLTRKQAMALAASRALQTRHAVSLAKLPPPIEALDESDHPSYGGGPGSATPKMMTMPNDNVVLAPPPEFCDIVDTTARVRIVGAVPKPKTKVCNHHHRLQSQNL